MNKFLDDLDSIEVKLSPDDIEYISAVEKEIEEEMKLTRDNDKKAMKTVVQLRGQSFKKYLKAFMKESEAVPGLELVHEPVGHWQSEQGFGSITGCYVDQTNNYPIEDSYSGTVTVKVVTGVFLQIPFSC